MDNLGIEDRTVLYKRFAVDGGRPSESELIGLIFQGTDSLQRDLDFGFIYRNRNSFRGETFRQIDGCQRDNIRKTALTDDC